MMSDLFHRLHVERVDPPLQRVGDFIVPLPHAAVRDTIRGESGLQCEIEFSARSDIGAKAFPRDQPEKLSVRVRLDGIIRDMRMSVERPLDMAAVIEEGLLAVDIQGSAELLRHGPKLDSLSRQDIVRE